MVTSDKGMEPGVRYMVTVSCSGPPMRVCVETIHCKPSMHSITMYYFSEVIIWLNRVVPIFLRHTFKPSSLANMFRMYVYKTKVKMDVLTQQRNNC